MAKVEDLESRLNATESRLSVAEFQQSHLTPRLERQEAKNELLAERVTRLEEKLAALPTKEYIGRLAMAILATIVSLFTLYAILKK